MRVRTSRMKKITAEMERQFFNFLRDSADKSPALMPPRVASRGVKFYYENSLMILVNRLFIHKT